MIDALVERRAALQAERAAALEQHLVELLAPRGDERALDVGTGAGALAFALAPHVREVVGVDNDASIVERGRADLPTNVELLVSDGEELPFEASSFDLAVTARTLHHTPRPERVVAELARVTRPGGVVLVADQVAPDDPLAAFELNRFEHARDASTTQVLTDSELRALFAANGLSVTRDVVLREPRDLEHYLDLAGCEGFARERARSLAPAAYEGVVGWFVLSR